MAATTSSTAGMIAIDSNVDGVLQSFAELRDAYPEAIDAAVRMEAVNIQRSIAASVRKLQVRKYKFEGLNRKGNSVYSARKLTPLSNVTKLIDTQYGTGSNIKTPGGVLGADSSVSVRVSGDSIEIGHKPALRDWILRWQNGIDTRTTDPEDRKWIWHRRIFALMGRHRGRRYTDEERAAVLSRVPSVGPERVLYPYLAEVVNRDFPEGLGKVLGKIVGGKLRKAERAEIKRAKGSWGGYRGTKANGWTH